MDRAVRHLSEAIRKAAARRRPLRIRGGGSKDFYGGEPRGEPLDVTVHRGIVAYEPTELVITARAGTALAEIEAALAGHHQMLAFEPPHFGVAATLGGCVAAGLSGPRRAAAGSVRDFVLGVRVLDGNGTALRFGGEVMKNVAGFDISRLMTGALGTLGLLTEVSLKVLPAPPAEATLRRACPPADALALMNDWAGKPLPVSATVFRDGELTVRLSGAGPAVAAAARTIGGTLVDAADAERFWSGMREQTDDWFRADTPLWRLSVRSSAPPLPIDGEHLLEWGGAQRWVRTTADTAVVRHAARSAGGHATLFRGAGRAAGVFHPLPAPLMALHRRLKHAFDPAGILNPGRLYPDL
ncbi:MAG: glycolate oxidase subunit GlcE [Burkholderiales bacterium]|nr:glycolate oxidase subunit GlcE [Burkholderiales bacterium]